MINVAVFLEGDVLRLITEFGLLNVLYKLIERCNTAISKQPRSEEDDKIPPEEGLIKELRPIANIRDNLFWILANLAEYQMLQNRILGENMVCQQIYDSFFKVPLCFEI
jgi:hypothetical protein